MQTRFVDCRSREAYLAGHVPGAAHADGERDLTGTVGGGRHPLPTEESFSAWASGAGIGAGTLVVGYDEGTRLGCAAVVAAAPLRPRRRGGAAISMPGAGRCAPAAEQLEPAEFVPRPRDDDTAERGRAAATGSAIRA